MSESISRRDLIIASLATAETKVSRNVSPDQLSLNRSIQIYESRSFAETQYISTEYELIYVAGYDDGGDGGAAFYRKVDAPPRHLARFRSADDAWWELVGESLNLSVFGKKYSDAILVAESYYLDGHAGSLILPPENVIIPRTVYFPIYVSIVGVPWKTVISPQKDAKYDDNVMFRMNIDNNDVWTQQYPGPRTGSISDVRFVNNFDVDLRCLEIGGGYRLSRVSAENFCQLVRANGNYVDQITYEECLLFWRPSPRDWPATHRVGFIGGMLGDGIRIDGCHCVPFSSFNSNDTRDYVSVSLSMCRGGTISNQINGRIELIDSSDVFISSGHFELGGIILTNSSALVISTGFYSRISNNINPIKQNNTNTGSTYNVSLRDVSFHVMENFGGVPVPPIPDVKLDVNGRLSVDKCFRRFGYNGNLKLQGIFGILVADESGALISDWSSKAAACSIDGSVDANGRVSTNTTVSCMLSSTFSAEIDRVIPKITLKSGVYFYTYQVIYDVSRNLGHNVNSEEVSIYISENSSGVRLQISMYSSVTIRIYRGMESGLYNYYADIPVVSAAYIYDCGSHISGFPWIPRTSSDVDSMSIPTFYGVVSWNGDLIEATCLSDETYIGSGSWKAGDKVYFPHGIDVGEGKKSYIFLRITTGSSHIIGEDFVWI